MSKVIKYFNVQGTLIINKEKIQFSKVIRASAENEAKEKVFLHYGSKHKIKRQIIKISSVKEMKKNQVDDPVGEEFSKAESFKIIRG